MFEAEWFPLLVLHGDAVIGFDDVAHEVRQLHGKRAGDYDVHALILVFTGPRLMLTEFEDWGLATESHTRIGPVRLRVDVTVCLIGDDAVCKFHRPRITVVCQYGVIVHLIKCRPGLLIVIIDLIVTTTIVFGVFLEFVPRFKAFAVFRSSTSVTRFLTFPRISASSQFPLVGIKILVTVRREVIRVPGLFEISGFVVMSRSPLIPGIEVGV